MRITTSTLYCDKCAKVLPEGYLNELKEPRYDITVYYKSIIYGISCKKVKLCKKCANEYFQLVKPFLNRAMPDDIEQGDLK